MLIFLLSLVATFTSVPPREVPPVSVVPLFCPLADDAMSVGSAVAYSGSLITATHALCEGQAAAFIGDASSDLTIILAGDAPRDCRDAEIGEPLVYLGYPATTPDGGALDQLPSVTESDQGVSAIQGMSITMCSFGELDCKDLTGVSIGSSNKVRPGYSGGAVLSGVDGRLVGIINGVGYDGSATFFTPVSAVCTALETLQ